MVDINGQELHEGGMALLLCEVIDVQPDIVRIRVFNSDLEMAVGVKYDEVLGGAVADSELTAFIVDGAAAIHTPFATYAWAEHDA